MSNFLSNPSVELLILDTGFFFFSSIFKDWNYLVKVFLSFIMLIFFSVFLGMVTVLKLVG